MKNSLLFKKAGTFVFWCAALLLLLVSQKGYSQLLVENFSYTTAGDLQTAASPNWAVHSGASINPYVQYTNTGLTFSGHAGSGVGGAATTSTTGTSDHNRAFTAQTSGTVYMSCLVKVTSVTASGDYFLHFNSTGTFAARIAATTNSGNLRFGVSKNSTATTAPTTNFALGTTYMIVVKYTYITGSTTNDQVDLWVLPTFASTEALAGIPLQTTVLGTDATTLGAACIRQGNPVPALAVDAIRVGTTWADVAPPATLINGGTTSSTAFSTTYGTASASQSFAVSGNLLTNPIVATAQTGFEVSRNDVVSYAATATYTASEANAGGVSFLVRLKDNASAGNFNAQNAVVLTSSPAPNANIVTSGSGNTLTPLGLTITGVTAQDKTFDGNTTAILNAGATLNGVLFSDDVILSGTPVAHFASAAVGTHVVTVTGYTISGTKAGNYTVSQPTVPNATINPSTLDDQVITFPSLSSVVYGTASVPLLATSDNPGGNPIKYISSNTAVATISGSTAIIVGAGTTIITASQAGDVTHNPGIDESESLTVTPLGITITGISALDKLYDTTTAATLTGTAALSPAPINADVVTIGGTPIANFASANAGTQSVTVTGYNIGGAQAGNYLFTPPTVANATITQSTQTIDTFSTIPALTTLTPPITLTGIASSGLTVTFESSDTNVATISGNVLTIVGPGSVTITAKQIGDINRSAAPELTQTRTVETAIYLNQFTGTSACPTQGNTPTVVANMTGGIGTRSTVTCSNLANFFSSTTLNVTSSIVNNSYIEFTATAATGYRLNLTKLSFLRSASGTAPNQLEVRYSTDGFATSTTMGNAVLTTTTATQLTWDFTDFTTPISGTVTFRMYPYGTQRADLAGGAAAATGTFRVDDITMHGSVVIPPPSLSTTGATLITSTSADLNGDVTNTGGSAILGNGAVISETSLNANPIVGGTQLPNPTFSAGTGTFSVASGTLAHDTQYSYAAYATNLQGTAYGSVATFYTHAITPSSAPTVYNETLTTLDVTLGTANEPNSATTQFAVRVVSGMNTYYLQSDYTLGTNPVWQNGFFWLSNAVVTGLTSNTSYTFDVKARNGANVETAFGPSTTLATLENLNPNLVLTSASPSFGNVCTTGTSNFATTSFTFNGAYLNSNNLSVGTAAAELTFSTSQNGTYSNPLTITNASASITGQVVWVKLSPSGTIAYNGTIDITGGGLASAFNVNTTGTGINTPATVTTGAISTITAVEATVAGTAVAECSSITANGIEYSTDSMFAGATQMSGLPATLTNLSPNTLYYVRAYANDASLPGIAYGITSSFTTLGLTIEPVATAATSVTGSSFIANWEAVIGAESYQLDVSTNGAFLGALTTVANWSFPNTTDDAVIDAGITANNGKTLTTVGGVGTISYTSSSSSITSAASGGSWDSGNGTKYWQIDISTVGYSDLKLSSAQRSSNSGPRDFKVQYSVNGGTNWFDVTAATVTVGNNWTSGVLSDIALPAACDNKTSVKLRWIMTSNFNLTAGAVVAGGNSGIDSIFITGRPPSFTVYENLSVNGLSQLVGGLAELTEYHYRVRAYSINSTSPNSNVIHVTTGATAPTFDSVSYSGTTVCDGANGTFDVSGLIPNAASRIYYDINGGPTLNVLTTVADVSGAATFAIPLTFANNFQLLTITLVERADASSSLVVESNNIVFITGIAANVTYYADEDTDTYGNPAMSQVTCTGPPSGFVSNNTDCDDADITKHASFSFYTDGDGDGYGAGTTTTSLCAIDANTPPIAGYSANSTDCDDANINIYQFATFYVDADGDTYGSTATASICSGLTTPAGYSTNNLDCDDTNALLNPTNPCVTGSIVNLTFFIEGYYLGGGAMQSVKLNQDFVSPAEEVQDVTIELHEVESPYALVETAIGTLMTDGTLEATFTNSGTYYIAVKGSNFVQTWTAEPQTLSGTTSYNFSTSASQAYADNMKLMEPGVYAFYSGDIDQSESIDPSDFTFWESDSDAGAFGVYATDLNGDGVVDPSDFTIWEANSDAGVFAFYPF